MASGCSHPWQIAGADRIVMALVAFLFDSIWRALMVVSRPPRLLKCIMPVHFVVLGSVFVFVFNLGGLVRGFN